MFEITWQKKLIIGIIDQVLLEETQYVGSSKRSENVDMLLDTKLLTSEQVIMHES